MASTPTSLGDYVRAIRRRKGVSIRQLARQVGIDRSYLTLIERGERPKPSADVIQRIADALGIEAMRLLRFVGVRSTAQTLPPPRIYFRRCLGVSAHDAKVLAGLVEDFQRNQKKGGNP